MFRLITATDKSAPVPITLARPHLMAVGRVSAGLEYEGETSDVTITFFPRQQEAAPLA